jgi:hypothetical protein
MTAVTYDYISLSDRSRRTFSQEFRLASSEAGRIFGGTTDWLAGLYLHSTSRIASMTASAVLMMHVISPRSASSIRISVQRPV